MKKLIKSTLILFFLLAVIAVNAQTKANGPILTFAEKDHDYGKIDIDNIPEAKLNVKFTNTGTQPLVLSNVRGCCGTRITDYTKEPILPGKSGNIKVEFEILPKIQTISRTVTVMSNSANSPDIFKIKGEVVEVDKSIIKKK